MQVVGRVKAGEEGENSRVQDAHKKTFGKVMPQKEESGTREAGRHRGENW